MPKLKDIIHSIEELAPPTLSEGWDNSGLQVGGENPEVTGILVALDPLPGVVQEAKDSGCNLIVTHHPLFFRPVKSLDLNQMQGSVAGRAIREGISIYSAHTSLDKVPYGVSDALARPMGLVKAVPIVQADGWPRGFGLGKIGELPKTMKAKELVDKLKDALGIKDARLVGDPDKVVDRVALCGGSGSDLIAAANSLGADIYITGDIKYHEALDQADGGMCLLDVGHYASELPVVKHFASLLRGTLEQKGWSVKVNAAKPLGEPWKAI
jgi:dinuclear metal center YbgI/SA1388 family protein